MLKRIDLPDFSPDTPLGVDMAGNMIALPNGYRPAKAFSPVAAALSGILGASSFVDAAGDAALLAGTASNLYTYTGTAWSSVLGSLSATSWRFDQFGDTIVCVNASTPVGFNIPAGTAAALSGSPPPSSLVATVRNQVFLAGDSSNRNTVTIGGYNVLNNWSGGTNQQLTVPFPTGGEIMGLCGGETGIILHKSAVRRATYTGDVTVWQFDVIANDVGCMAKGSVAQSGQLVFFLSEQGFKMCDRNEVIPIGMEAVDRTFFASYARTEIVDNIRAAVDPRDTTVTWSMPGTPGALWRYNWMLKKWSPPTQINISGVFSGFSKSYSIEGIDALYPSGIDSVPYSLDATIFAGGNPLLFVIDNTGKVGTLTGDNLAAYISLQPQEIDPGYRVRIQGARVVGDVVAGTVTIDQRARAGDGPNEVRSGSIRDNGRVPLRANGRHMGIRIDIPSAADWTYALSIDIEYTREGAR